MTNSWVGIVAGHVRFMQQGHVTATTVSLVESGMLTLVAGKAYHLEAKRGSTWIMVYGAKFVETT